VAFPQTAQFRATIVLPARVERLTKARLFVRPKGYGKDWTVDRHTGRLIGAYMDYINPWTEEVQQVFIDNRDRERLAVALAKVRAADLPIATVRSLLAALQEIAK
jgi:hypothetical protein